MELRDLTKRRVIEKYNGLHELGAIKYPLKVGYMIAHNKGILAVAYQKIMEPINKVDPRLKEYHEERILLAKSLAMKDEKKHPVVDKNNQFVFDFEGQEKFTEELKKLKEKYREALDDDEKFRADLPGYLDDPDDLFSFEGFKKIPLKQLRSDIEPNKLQAIIDLLEDD